MRPPFSAQNLLSTLTPGTVFRRKELLPFTHSVGRDLKTLEEDGKLKRLSMGLYYYPKHSSFGGVLPPDEKELVEAFLNDSRFLVVPPNKYNKLGLGLTQLHNFAWVYNRKRFVDAYLGGLEYRFRRPVDFPATLSTEYLLVDLLNNINEVGEDADELKTRVKTKLPEFDKEKVLENTKLYGKVAAQHFFESAYQEAGL